MSAPLIGKTASGSFGLGFGCAHEQRVKELEAKIASLEREKADAHKRGEEEQIAKSNRQAIEEMIPRNLPQYRTDEDFNREVELRVNQINEYTSLDDLRGLYDGKLLKYAKTLETKTASMKSSNRFSYIQDPLHNIVGNNMIHSKNSNRIPTYDPIARQYYNNSRTAAGRTASSSNNNGSPWYLELFDSSNFQGS